MDEKRRVLEQYFGYPSFREGQEGLIDAQLRGRDAFGIMPTGGGKSLCYQIPALLLPGITLVVSPLISLMQDQVRALCSVGIPAAYLNSTLSGEQLRLVYRNLRRGRYRIVYVAPERLPAEEFLEAAEELDISLVAVDEAHCISQWGQDFRPSYLRIVEFLDRLPRRPVVSAFTATATPAVREDVIRILGLRDPLVTVTGFDRPNLRFEVCTPENKKAELLTQMALRREKSGIVYCSTRKTVEEVCRLLQDRKIAATRYHAGLSDGERQQNQEDFLYDRCTVMVATNAFGMGIDKSNVSYVIHYNMPQSLESYYQEAGRAGRDGEKADCILLFGKGDIRTAKYFIRKTYEESSLPEEERQRNMEQELQRLYKMVGYCQTDSCLRRYILSYFGEILSDRCGNCGSCAARQTRRRRTEREAAPRRAGKEVTKELTREAQMILSCVRRITDALGHSTTVTMTVRVLRGSRDRRLLEAGLDRLSTYGLMAAYSREEVREIIALLKERGLLSYGRDEIVSTTPGAGGVLFRGERVSVTLTEGEMEERFPRSGCVAVDSGLLTALKELRRRLAAKERVPPYVIFTNASLTDMAEKRPGTEEELLGISGVGRVKAQRYGKAVLELIGKRNR